MNEAAQAAVRADHHPKDTVMTTSSTPPNNFTDKQLARAKMVVGIFFCSIGAIVCALLAYHFNSQLNKVDYTTAKILIGGEFPRAVTYQHAQTQSCTDFVMNKRDFLKLSGIDGDTAWGLPWSMAADGEKVTLTYPLEDSSSPEEVGQQLIDDLAPTELEKLAPDAMLSIKMVGTDLIAEYRCGRASRRMPEQ